MHRLVIALTTLLTLTGGLVVAAYLVFFTASPDRAASIAPADTLVYANLYLQPSAAQRANLNGLITRFPGFGDPATLEGKIDELLQRFLRDAGLDYGSDLKPWLGDQLALALGPSADDSDEMELLVIAHARDPDEALAAIPRIAAARDDELRPEEHAGTPLWVGTEATYALVGDNLVVGDRADQVRVAIDTHRGEAPALADEEAFHATMETLPTDHMGSLYADLVGLARSGGSDAELAGYSTAGIALVAETGGFRFVGHAPFDGDEAPESVRRAFALATEPSSLTGWMPAQTQAALVIFGTRQAIETAEDQLGAGGTQGDLAMALNQLRGIAAFMLGINVDTDLLPLLDRESALALTRLDSDPPSGLLLMRPSDPQAGSQALERITSALEQRGSRVTSGEMGGVTVTTVSVPQLVDLSWAASEGVILMAVDAEIIGEAIDAHRSGMSLAGAEGYRATFDLVERHAGNELYLDARALLALAAATGELPADMHAMLEPIQALGLTIPARDDRLEFHLVIPID